MQMILLVEERFGSVPEKIRIVQKFGDEMIVTADPETTTRGVSMFLVGAPEVFADWLRPFDGFWTSENPLLGEWTFQCIEEGQSPAAP